MVNKTKNYDNFLQAFLKAGQNSSFAKFHLHFSGFTRLLESPGKIFLKIMHFLLVLMENKQCV